MGTNYYYEPAPGPMCPTCKHQEPTESLHIGKSSAGWVFALRIWPEKNIHTLEDWKMLWASGGQIRDEYGGQITPQEMLTEITQRFFPRGLRTQDEGQEICRFIKPGERTFKLCNYEFS